MHHACWQQDFHHCHYKSGKGARESRVRIVIVYIQSFCTNNLRYLLTKEEENHRQFNNKVKLDRHRLTTENSLNEESGECLVQLLELSLSSEQKVSGD